MNRQFITFETEFGVSAVAISEILQIEMVFGEVIIYLKTQDQIDIKIKDEDDKNRWIEIIKNL